MAPRIVLTVFVVALSGILGAAVLHLLTIGDSLKQILVGGTAIAVMFGTQVARTTQRGMRLSRAYQHWVLAVQAICTFLPMLVLGTAWVGLPGLLAGSLLLTLRAPWSWLGMAGCLASVVLVTSLSGWPALEVAYNAVSTLTTCAVVYGLTKLAEIVIQLRAAQQEIARLAVEEERLRFARDLHDLLGYSLSAITLRSELAHRLVDADPPRAKDEVTHVLEISRQALADVRAVARSYRNISLPAEISSAVSVFEAAGIEAEVDTTLENIPDSVGTVLATVLREGVTNLLRHSKVRRCQITVCGDADCAVLRLVNDGVQPLLDPQDPTTPRPDSDGGSGIGNLAARVAAIGGSLEADVREDGCFHLEARIPHPASGRKAASGPASGRRRPAPPSAGAPASAPAPASGTATASPVPGRSAERPPGYGPRA
ncbi:sensor histidine kinase [Streptomyces sp. NPDC053499]|uniref:sensor histidine kinase n=1 Tax=Streptomyces sp. NPDC053499 TaxID=3365707 RepID=UPI0037CD2B7C